MTEGSIPTHHEPVMGRSFGPNGMPPENNAPFTADARSVDGQAVLGSDDHAASFSQTRVRLSASLFPADAALANRGGVPLGAVVHPFRAGARADETAMPARASLAKPPARCDACGAFANGFCVADARNGHWACCFCGAGNVDRSLIVDRVDADARALPDLASREVEYVFRDETRDDCRGRSLRPSSTEPARRPPVVFAIDEALDPDEARDARRAVGRALDALPDDASVGLVAFAGAVSVYDVAASARRRAALGREAVAAAASVVPGHASPSARDLSDVFARARGGPTRFLARLGDEGVRETLAAVVSSLAPARRRGGEGAARTRPRSLGAAVETAVAVLDGAFARDGDRDGDGDVASRGRVIVCLGGPPTRGPGAAAADETAEFYDAEERAARARVENLAETVRSLRVSVDVFSCGREAASASRLAPLAARTGGVFVVEEDFGDAFARNLASAAARPTPRDATLTIRASKGVRVAQLVGADSEVISAEDASRVDGAAGRGESSPAAAAFALRGADGCESSVSAIFEYDYAASLDAPAFVHLQFISWIDGVGDWRAARCVTLRVATTSSAVAYARAVHAPTASLLAARLLVVEALREEARRPGTSASWLRRRCDARVEKRVASVAEAFDAGGAFPEPLVAFAEAMYHLRRGPMFGRGFGHDDEKTAARLAFLRASHEVACRSLVPAVYAWKGVSGTDPGTESDREAEDEARFATLPASDLALAPRAAIVVDHGAFGAFGWIARDVGVAPGEAGRDAAAAAATREAAIEAVASLATRLARGARSGSRSGSGSGSDAAGGSTVGDSMAAFPAFPSLVATEGSSAARRAACRLAPAHRDAPHEQDARFPPVRGTSLEARRAFAARALPTEEQTFFQWMRGLGVDAPVTPWAPWR